jgi:hypothetical protein
MTLRVLIWATTFGADLWSFARYLDARDDIELIVQLDNPDQFRREGVASLFPLQAPLRSRASLRGHLVQARAKPDVTVFDNTVPRRARTRSGFALWHGFGWKGPDKQAGLPSHHRRIERAWGSAKQPNHRFRWQCFGPWDLDHQSTVNGIHTDNCRLVGAVSHDDLRSPIDRSLARPYYPFDVTKDKTILIAPTWHYGKVFDHWGEDGELFERLIQHKCHSAPSRQFPFRPVV